MCFLEGLDNLIKGLIMMDTLTSILLCIMSEKLHLYLCLSERCVRIKTN